MMHVFWTAYVGVFAAVAIGETLAGVSRFLVAGVTAAGVARIVATVWRSRDDVQGGPKAHSNQEAAMVSCASVLFSELLARR